MQSNMHVMDYSVERPFQYIIFILQLDSLVGQCHRRDVLSIFQQAIGVFDTCHHPWLYCLYDWLTSKWQSLRPGKILKLLTQVGQCRAASHDVDSWWQEFTL